MNEDQAAFFETDAHENAEHYAEVVPAILTPFGTLVGVATVWAYTQWTTHKHGDPYTGLIEVFFVVWILLHIGIAFVKINGKRHLERADIFKRRREAAATERKEQEERSSQEQEAREVRALQRRKTIRAALAAQSPATVRRISKRRRASR